MAINLAVIYPIIPWLCFAVAGALAFYLYTRLKPYLVFDKARRKRLRVIELVDDAKRRHFELENVDATDWHNSPLSPERFYGPLRKKIDSDMFGVKVYTGYLHSHNFVDYLTVAGIQALMNISHSATPDEALGKYRRARETVNALDYVVQTLAPNAMNIKTAAPVQTLSELKETFEKTSRKGELTPATYDKITKSLRICEAVAKENNIDAGIPLQDLYKQRDLYFKLYSDEKIQLQDGMMIDVAGIVTAVTADQSARDIGSIVHASMEAGEKKASDSYDMEKVERREKQFTKFMIFGIIILGIIGGVTALILLAGPGFIQDITNPAPVTPGQGGGNPLSGLIPGLGP